MQELIGSDGSGLVIRDMADGTEVSRLRKPRAASTLYADGRFIVLDERGTLSLLGVRGDTITVHGQFDLPETSERTWARPALAGTRLYVRAGGDLHVYELGDRGLSMESSREAGGPGSRELQRPWPVGGH